MTRTSALGASVLVLVNLAIPPQVSAVVLEETAATTGATRVLLWARGEDSVLIDGLTGWPVDPPSIADSVASHGGVLCWRATRDDVDGLGYHHVFFRQHYRPEPGSIPGLEGVLVPMAGGELGFHYNAEGTLYAVAGARYLDVASVGRIQLRSVTSARETAYAALAAEGLAPANDGSLPPEALATLRSNTRLFLASQGDGRTFEFVWEVPFIRVEGDAITADLDGDSGYLLRHWNPIPTSTCEPSSYAKTSAIGVPQNPSIPNRDLLATPTSDQPGFTHEGHFPYDITTHTDIVLYQGEGQDACAWDGNQSYSVLPQKTSGGTVTYNDYSRPKVVWGRAGADAIWKTYQTMVWFRDHGWFGWNGKNYPSRIVVEARCPSVWDNSTFTHTSVVPYAPSTPWRFVND
jgi:hypothetical protein